MMGSSPQPREGDRGFTDLAHRHGMLCGGKGGGLRGKLSNLASIESSSSKQYTQLVQKTQTSYDFKI